MTRKTIKGFTLIELSIVLVIISLIIGGVMVGQSLVEQARLKQVISQINEIKQVVNTYKNFILTFVHH